MSAIEPVVFPKATPGAPAEEQAAAFEDDPRVHFDTLSGRWRLEDGDSEFEYDPFKAVWIPVVSLPLPAPQKLRWTCARCYRSTRT
jgi:HIV Tat-specific factor 1